MMITLTSVFIVLLLRSPPLDKVGGGNPSRFGMPVPCLDVSYYSKQYPKSQVIITFLYEIV